MNSIKTLLLLVTLTVILITAGAALGGKQGMIIALVFALGMNFFSYWYSDKIVLKMYGAREITESDAPELYGIVRRLAKKSNMPMPKVYIIHQAQPNAFATGRNPNNAAVAVTTGIMHILTREELQGVIGHELAHIKHRDILISTVAATIAGAITYLTYFTMFFGHGDDDEGGNPLVALFMLIIGPIAAFIIQMAISRSREYAADEGGARIAGNPHNLAGALRKLHVASKKIPMKANPATSHMFIVNPLSGGGITKLFSTHPPIDERISKLESIGI